ncbi:type III restriction enzyme [Scenedesmus sp. NREL 46B-D3]|nr:type III restriction enzyme [Scenedesmus sp. NREL 46B-D3]
MESPLLLTRKGLKVCKEAADGDAIASLKRSLTIAPLAAAGQSSLQAPPVPFPAYVESATALYVPRFFPGVAAALPLTADAGADAAAAAGLVFCGSLRQAQADVVKAGIEQCHRLGGGLLVLPTGFGKTVCALWMACALGKRTLVLAHKGFLLDQWAERIAQYVPAARVGRIQQGTVDVEGKDIVLGMMQSVSMRDYPASVFDGFGLTIVDECHHISAPVFSRSMFKCTSHYMLGLSATPDRKDGLGPAGETPLMAWFLGPVIADRRRQGMPEDVRVAVHAYHCPQYDLPPPMMRGGATINLAKVVTGMVQDAARNELLVSAIAKLAAEGRKVLCLSDRRAHCKLLKALLAERCPLKEASLYLGGMKPAELAAAAATADILLASYGLASEGLDIPTLDTLVLSTPRSSIEQAVGRILRGAPNPLVVDVLDCLGVCYAQHNKRRAFYVACGFKVERAAAADGYAFVADDDDDAT